jgi:hypothetical protein
MQVIFMSQSIIKMNLNSKISANLLGVAGIATAILLDAAPSKANLFIDFIPLNPTQTRIKASGTINPSLLGTSSAGAVSTAPSGGNTSAINKAADALRFSYSPTVVSNPGRRYAITGPTTNPFAGGGNFAWTGTTPTNNPPLQLRFGTDMDLWFPNTFTGGASPLNSDLPVDGFFDVNLSLAQIGFLGSSLTFTSGSEQIILSNNYKVPGPLPLLGAAAAFGYSRKLRNRIQKSTPSRTA